MSRMIRRMTTMKRRGDTRAVIQVDGVGDTRACVMNKGSRAGEHTDNFNRSALMPLAESYVNVCQKIVHAT
jgi:hypothetical protein